MIGFDIYSIFISHTHTQKTISVVWGGDTHRHTDTHTENRKYINIIIWVNIKPPTMIGFYIYNIFISCELYT